MSEAQTIIIGAGAAGLAAGAALASAGKPFLILEARDRVGGRVHTIHEEHWPLPLEFGAEFIHGRPPQSWDLVREAKLRVYDTANEHWNSREGKPVKKRGGWEGMAEIMGRLDRVDDRDLSFADFLKQECGDVAESAKKMARAYVEGLDAADAEIVSAQSIKRSDDDGDTFDADKPFRIFDGYDRLLGALVQPIPPDAIRLNTVVRSVEWSSSGVVVETTAGDRFTGGRLVITLPIGVLLAGPRDSGAVRFDPPLPPKMRRAIDHLRMGPVVKVLLRFRRAFWAEGPWQDMAFLHSPGAVFPTWWTMLPVRVPMLTAWAGGPAAAALSHRPAKEVIDAALKTLAPLLGVTESMLHTELAAWHVSDWQADPYARGAYAFAVVGGANAAQQMAEPIDDVLFFAGEATHPGYAGTVAAAIASGQRAARQILASPGYPTHQK